MPPLCPLLTSLLLLASPAEQPADGLPGWETVLEQYAGLDPARQQRWIGNLLARLDRANRVVLTPDEADAERARAMRLSQRARDRTISRSELIDLLRQTDAGEKAAVERLARRFRIRVYNTFRLRRDEFTRRRAAWDRVLAGWEAAGRPLERQSQLIDWLEAAIRSSTPGSVAPVPDVPSFVALAEVPRPLVLKEPVDGMERPGPPAIGWTPVPVPRPAISLPELGRRAAKLQSAHPSAGGEAQLPEPTPVPPAAGIGPRPAVGGPSSMSPRWPAGILPGIDRQPVAGLPLPDRPLLPAPPPAVPERLPATDRTLATAARANRPPARSVEWPEALAAKLDDPPPTRPMHRVNLAELTTRVAGNNLALQALEAELDETDGWDARRLAPLVERLRPLVLRHNDLALFRELISPGERSLVGRPESPQAAISRLAARISEARTRAAGPGFIGTEARRRAELRDLDELSRQLALLASQK